MAITYNGFFGATSIKQGGTSLIVNAAQGTTVAVDDDIFVGFAGDPGFSSLSMSSGGSSSITWAQEATASSTGNVAVQFWRGTVTAGGTLTSITISWTTSITAKAAVAGWFSGVGTSKGTSGNNASSEAVDGIDTAGVVEGDLIIGVGGWEVPNDDDIAATAVGGWTDSVQDIFQIGTTGQGSASNITSAVGYGLVNSTGFGTGDKLQLDNLSGGGDVCACGAAYGQAASGPTHSKDLSDTVTLSDAITKAAGPGKADSITLTDGFSRVWVASLSLGDIVTLSDAAAKTPGLTKSDTTTLSDAAVKLIGPHKADAITLSDAFERSLALSRSFDDSITLTDDAAKAVSVTRSDAITLSDAAVKAAGLTKSDAITLADAIVKATGLVKSDTITLTDAFDRTWVVSRSFADTITLSDAAAKAVGLAQSDTITLTDAAEAVKGGATLTLNLGDTITLSDAVSKAAGLVRSDAFVLSDSLSKAFGITKSDLVLLSDAISKSPGLTKTDIIALTDEASRSVGVLLTDSVSLTDAITKSAGVMVSDTIVMVDNRVILLNGQDPEAGTGPTKRHIVIAPFGMSAVIWTAGQ